MAHQFSCQDAGDDCNCFLEASVIDEVAHHAQDHAERKHDKQLSHADVEDLVTHVGR